MALPLARTLLVAVLAAIPVRVSAQSWPEIGLLAGLGISVADARGSVAGMVALTRAWGPIVGAVGGELRVAADGDSGNRPRYDPLNGRFYCDNQQVSSGSYACFTSLRGEGALTGEIGFTLAPLAPLVLTAGYRTGATSEPMVAATIFGSTRRNRVSWMGRVAAGRTRTLIAAGVVLELGVPFE